MNQNQNTANATVITRGTGRSAVAAAAYMSCSKIYNDYDGITHDYTRKQGACMGADIPARICAEGMV